ncbi:hypothetical protein BC628DRAFT_1410871 [Trametes gibbosa]|uniref:RBR-type E3 ubiquitin transferase n=1 Tax=Trametes gibbosa TaxID=160864 RepID=A0A6G6FQP7_9APHY|nr:hypothetical protein BC628DRAFT_1410871 [Trametes gibbosa]QIE48557.1 hypothetical protein [Trametes gibbosa]
MASGAFRTFDHHRTRDPAPEVLMEDDHITALRICSGRTSDSGHLAVEDIYKTPVFQKSMTHLSSSYGPSNYAFFTRILQGLADVTKERGASACTIITRPPEILACFSIADVPAGTQLFVIFDSHPRPDKHPHGAAFIFFNSVRETARYLSSLLHFDEDILEEEGVQWQAQLLSQCSGDVFVASDTPVNGMQWADAALEASLQALSAQARVRELEEQKHELEGEKKRLREEIVGLEHDLLRIDDLFQRERQERKRERDEYARRQYAAEHTQGSNWVSYVSTWWNTKPAATGPSGSGSSTSEHARRDADSKGDNSTTRGLSNGSTEHRNGKKSRGDTKRKDTGVRGNKPRPHQSPDPIPDVDPLAVQLQICYDEENRALEEQFRQLQAEQPQVFDCGICFETFQEDHIAHVHPCEHAFCRGCLTGWAASKIDEHRYPVLCPTCVADRPRLDPPGEVDYEAVQQLGLTEQQYEIFVEMQMNKFSTMVNCRGCKKTLFVDKQEYRESKIIRCPLMGCGYMWCKLCSQNVDPVGPEHSCDGTNELEHIMKQNGWKYCPGCQTPAEKIAGCNHMTCMAPGCNTHFCYLCGDLIVRSALPGEISTAMSAHYTRCTLM